MKPAIEPILELREVALCLFGAKGVVGAAKRALDVAQNRIDPMKLGMLRTGPPAPRHHRVMGTPRIGHGMKTRQPIREHPAACAQVLPRPCGELDVAEPLDDRELHALRMAPVVGLDGGEEGGLAGRPATGLPAASLTAQDRRRRARYARRAGAGGLAPPSPASACASCARRRCRRCRDGDAASSPRYLSCPGS